MCNLVFCQWHVFTIDQLYPYSSMDFMILGRYLTIKATEQITLDVIHEEKPIRYIRTITIPGSLLILLLV